MGTVRLHHLLAVFVRAVTRGAAAQTAVEDVLRAEAERLYRAGYPGRLLALQPHLQTVTEAAQPRGDVQAARLDTALGHTLHLLGDYAGAQPAYERALAITEQVLGPDHPDTARRLNNLALLYRDQGRYGEAEPLYRQALAITEQVLGLDPPDTAAVRENYAILLRHRSREVAPSLSLGQRIRAWLSRK